MSNKIVAVATQRRLKNFKVAQMPSQIQSKSIGHVNEIEVPTIMQPEQRTQKE